jgi:hypothetical protein
MGLLKRLMEGVQGAPPRDLTFVPSISEIHADIDGIGQTIKPDSCYIELYLESLRLSRARRFATRFQGVAYSFVTLSREGMERAQLAAVSKPQKLADLDGKSLDKVITVSKRMMGASAYRGGPVSIELGLFSVKIGNLLTPVLDYVNRVSSTAGISFVGTIKPFLPLITEGMDLIAGQKQDTELEVGIEIDLALKSSCVMAILDLPKGSIDIANLSLDKDRKLLLDGDALDCGYAVFSIRPQADKIDFGDIPELAEPYLEFLSAIKKGKIKDAQDALGAFRLAAIASPDLIPADVDRLIEKAKQKFKKAFPPGGFASVGKMSVKDESLYDIGLYE